MSPHSNHEVDIEVQPSIIEQEHSMGTCSPEGRALESPPRVAKASQFSRRIGRSRSPSPTTKPVDTPASGSKNASSLLPILVPLVALYEKALACKMYEVEELIDFYFHRRLAAVTTIMVYYLTPYVYITPNQITLAGLFIGWGAGFLILSGSNGSAIVPDYLSPTVAWLLGSFLFFLWIVSDCADGQVARLCRRGTRTGRIVDGCVDALVLTPACFCIKWATEAYFGYTWSTLAVISGFSLGFHAGLYDKIKNVYMNHALPVSETDGESPETVYVEYLQAKRSMEESNCLSNAFECCLLWVYHKYLIYQKLFGGSVEPTLVLSPAAKVVYRRKYAWIVRLASWLGISTHITLMYISWAIAPFFPHALVAFLFINSVGLNALHLYVLYHFGSSGMKKPDEAQLLKEAS